MPPSENVSIEAAFRGKLEYDRATSERIKTADTVARLVYLLVAGIVALTLYMGRLQWTVGQHSIYVDELKKAEVRARVRTIERYLEHKDHEGFDAWLPQGDH